MRPSNIQLTYQLRNFPARGPIISAEFNDMIEETATDLMHLTTGWNESVVPLFSTIPDGSDDVDVDAITNGLDGANLYTNALATTILYSDYYNGTDTRPNTIFEQFENVYTLVTTTKADLEDQITGFSYTAAQTPITDVGGLYASTEVEGALQEIMTAVNAISSVDLSAVSQHILPATNTTYTLGNSSYKWKELHAQSINFSSTASLSGGADSISLSATTALSENSTFNFGGLNTELNLAGQFYVMAESFFLTTPDSYIMLTETYPITSLSVYCALNANSDISVSGEIFALGSVDAGTDTTTALYINTTTGQLGLNSSSARFKENITDMEDTTWLHSLRPVNFNYQWATGRREYGLIAEEVAAINPDLVFRNSKTGEIDGVHYDRLISILINEVQKLKEEVSALKK